MSGRIVTRHVRLGGPSWRLAPEKTWLLGDDELPRAAAMLDLAAPVDIPAAPFVPSPAPGRLQPIDGQPVAEGIALPWNRWTEINSRVEGHFMERFAPGAFTKTLRDRQNPVVPLLNHGQDPQAGWKPLGRLQAYETSDGLRFSLAFLDAAYARDVAAGARAGVYGASVRFATLAERVRSRPAKSRENRLGIPERTITEAKLTEISLTPIPQYSGTKVAIAA
jgi:Escherichia/Staphylococcus phage prohead protease